MLHKANVLLNLDSLVATTLNEKEVITLQPNKYQSHQSKLKANKYEPEISTSRFNDVDEEIRPGSIANNETDIQLSADKNTEKYEDGDYIRNQYNKRSRQLYEASLRDSNTSVSNQVERLLITLF